MPAGPNGMGTGFVTQLIRVRVPGPAPMVVWLVWERAAQMYETGSKPPMTTVDVLPVHGVVGPNLSAWWMEPDGEAGGRDPPSREFDSPHSPWVQRPNAAGRDGDLTGFIRPKISGQYGALRLGASGPTNAGPCGQTEEAAGRIPVSAPSHRDWGSQPAPQQCLTHSSYARELWSCPLHGVSDQRPGISSDASAPISGWKMRLTEPARDR
jgi:hypothetical protein